MRVLVTGASGLLGINLALEAAKEHTVFGLVNHLSIRAEAFEVIQADLLIEGALERVLDQVQPDWVIHCAALAILDTCEVDPEKARKINTEIPTRLAMQLVSPVVSSGARLLHISTDSVFDGQRGNYTEDDPPNPLSVYAKTKFDGEVAVLAANPQALIARVNMIGWSIIGTRSLSEFFFNNLRAGNQVMGFTDVFFCPLLVNDLAKLLLKMLEMNLTGLYHVVSSDSLSKYDFGVRLAKLFELDDSKITPTSVEKSGLKAARSPRLTLNVNKLTSALNESPHDVITGLIRLYELYLQGYPEYLRSLGRIAPG